jgi:EAL domain-containing protein (putative c-di-GMP-specific phosphodiesterase class I)
MGIGYGQGYLFGRPASTPFAASLANANAPLRSADVKTRASA